jgi:2-keto-4-pentenoate hydratase
MARLADLQSHGALVLGAPMAMSPDALDLRTVQAGLWFDADCAACIGGGNLAQDVWLMVTFLHFA